jgi:hypothetical protein
MIEFEFITYSDAQWDRIKIAVRDALGLNADQIDITGSLSLRDRIETIVSMYLFQSASTRQSPRRAELIALRKDAETLRARIIDALAVLLRVIDDGLDAPALLRPGVDGDMMIVINDFFTKLAPNLDRQIKQAGERGDNARKTARDHCWSELLAIWCDLGGKATGKATASFLIAASRPVMGSAVPDITSVMRWLERRQNKTANKGSKSVRRTTR